MSPVCRLWAFERFFTQSAISFGWGAFLQYRSQQGLSLTGLSAKAFRKGLPWATMKIFVPWPLVEVLVAKSGTIAAPPSGSGWQRGNFQP